MEHELSITRVLAAPAEEVYDAWLDAQAVAQWMRPIAGGHTEAQNDPRVGGGFLIVMHGNGTQYPTRGEYLRLERPHLLEFTWHPDGDDSWNSIVSVTLKALGAERTELTLRHRRFPTASMAEGHRAGWNNGLDSFARWLETKR